MSNNGDGAITVTGAAVSGEAELESNGDGDITVTDLTVGTDGRAVMSNNGDGAITVTGAAVSGDAELKSNGDGNITVTDLTVGTDGSAIMTNNGTGDIRVDSAAVSGEAELKSNGDGNITVTDLTVGAEGETVITTNGTGDITITDSVLSGEVTVSNNKDKDGKDSGNGSGSVSIGTADQSDDEYDVIIDGKASISTGSGDMSLVNTRIDGTANITSAADGAIALQDADVSATGVLTMSNQGEGGVDMDDVNVAGDAAISTGSGDADMDTIHVQSGGSLELDTGSGDVTMGEKGGADDNKVIVDGTAAITSGSGDISLHQVDVSTSGKLYLNTGSQGGDDNDDNDVIVDDVYVDGLLTVTAKGSGSDLLMQNNDSRLVLDKNFRESIEAGHTEEMFFDIGGNIGAPELYFKVSYEGKHDETEPAKDNLTLNIRNANDIFLTQLTDIATEIPGGEDTGVLEGELVKTEHDESISNLGNKDIQIRIPEQSPEELAKQLSENLENDKFRELIHEKLTAAAVRDVLTLSETSISEALATMSAAQMATLWNTVVTGTAPVLEEKLSDVQAMREALEQSGTDVSSLSDSQVQQSYEDYYQNKRSAYEKQTTEAILRELNAEERISGDKIDALLALSGSTAPAEDILIALISGEKIKVDVNGEAVQATDEADNKLYLDAEGNLTTEAQNADGVPNEPVYEMEPLLDDESELFRAYWDSLTDEQKKTLIENAYLALEGSYPPVEDHTGEPRELTLKIGTSTGESYLLNIGDITIEQEQGTFTAGEVVSTHGDVSITAPAIEGVAAADKESITDPYVLQMYEKKYVGEKTEDGRTTYGTEANVYAENHSYTATEGGIGAEIELTTEQRSWKEDVIANIQGEDPLPTEYNDSTSQSGEGSWDILRNENGEIEMNFTVSFNGIRDNDLLSETSLQAIAKGDIAITELTGDQKVDSVESMDGSVTLKAPDGSQNVENVNAGENATLEASGDQKVESVSAGEDVTLVSGGNTEISHITAGGHADITAQGSILDGRQEGDDEVNVDAASGSMTAETGTIGADSDERIDVRIDDHLTTDSFGDTNLNAEGDLNLTADTTEGVLHVDGDGNLSIDNSDGDMDIGAIEAAGNVDITAQGSLVPGDKLDRDAQIKGDDISVTAKNGHLGAETAPLLVDTNPHENGDPGVLNAQANNGSVYITEITDDMTIGNVISTGKENSVHLKTEDGSIVESDKTADDLIKNAVDAAVEAAKAKAEAEALQDQVDVLKDYVDLLDKTNTDLNDAKDALDNAEAAKAQAESDLANAQTAQKAAEDALEQARSELEQLENSANPDPDELTAKQQALADAEKAHADAIQNTGDAQTALKDAQNDLDNAKAQLENAMDQAEDDTYGTVDGLGTADSIDEALQALKEALDTHEQKLSDKTNELQEKQKTADELAKLAEEAADKAESAESTGIVADGDVNLEANSSDGSASFGEKDNALGITAGGTTNIRGGEGTTLENVDIESGSDLTIGNMETSGEVNLTAKGDIKGDADNSDRDIIAPSANLGSLKGDIGSKDDPLKTRLDEVSAYGESVYLDNDKDLAVDSIIGEEEVDLKVNGDITDGDSEDSAAEDDADIIGGDVNIDAEGNIGSKDDPLDVEADELGATGDDITISSEGDVKVDEIEGSDVDISSGGSVTDKDDDKDSIIADNLHIDAGTVGEKDNPLNILVSGNVDIHALYGYIHYRNSYRAPTGYAYRTLIHEPTGVRVSGYFSFDAELFVDEACEHGDCLLCKYLSLLPDTVALARYRLSVSGDYYGMLLVQIPVDEEYEGQIVTIAYCEDGELRTIQVRVKDGFASFFIDELHTFVVLNGPYHVVTENGQQLLASDATGEVILVNELL